MHYDSFGSDYHLITLSNEFISITVSDLGANLIKVLINTKSGQTVDVLLGYSSPEDYLSDDENFIGAQLGRYADLISNACFYFKDDLYYLDRNAGKNTVNSGFAPWSQRNYALDKITDDEVILNLISQDGDQGFPGMIDIEIRYHLLENGFEITYSAVSSSDTIWNVTARNYFNLNGEGNGNVLNHLVKLYADFHLVNDQENIPNGNIEDVTNTPLDFRIFKTLGRDIDQDFRDLKNADGYATYFVTDNKYLDDEIHRICEVIGDQTHIKLIIETDYPGFLLYSSQKLKSVAGKNNHIYNKYDGIVLVPQFFPNAPNIPSFEQPILHMGIRTVKTIRYLFEG